MLHGNDNIVVFPNTRLNQNVQTKPTHVTHTVFSNVHTNTCVIMPFTNHIAICINIVTTHLG